MSTRTAAPARRIATSWTPWLLLVGLVVTAFLLTIATVAGEDGDAPGSDELLTSTAEVVGQPLPRFVVPGAEDAAVGQSVPVASGVDLAGAPLDIVPGADGPTLLIFVAHWCPHCQREVPTVQGLIDRGLLPENLTLLAVTSGISPVQPNYPPTAWLEREGWSVPTLIDGDDGLATAYGLSGYPFWVAVDGQGRVLARAAGALGEDSIRDLAAAVANPSR